jgi:5-methylcytosine-specific restriction endonuclease McrA
MALKPCLDCGRLTTGSRCPPCRRASPYQRSSWRQTSLMVTQRDGSCVRCGSRYYLSAHHVIARNEGGSDDPSNLVSLCVRCHAREEAERRRVS